MKFQEIKGYKYTKYVVEVEYFITKDQKMLKPDKTFDDIHKAIAYIKEIKKEAKQYPELYKNYKIWMHRIKTVADDFLVLEGE